MSRIYRSIRAAKKFAFKLIVYIGRRYDFRRANKNNWSNAIKMSVRINRCPLIKYLLKYFQDKFHHAEPQLRLRPFVQSYSGLTKARACVGGYTYM